MFPSATLSELKWIFTECTLLIIFFFSIWKQTQQLNTSNTCQIGDRARKSSWKTQGHLKVHKPPNTVKGFIFHFYFPARCANETFNDVWLSVNLRKSLLSLIRSHWFVEISFARSQWRVHSGQRGLSLTGKKTAHSYVIVSISPHWLTASAKEWVYWNFGSRWRRVCGCLGAKVMQKQSM